MRLKLHSKLSISIILTSLMILLGVYFYLSTSLGDFLYQRITADLTKHVALAQNIIETQFSQDGRGSIFAISESIGLRVTLMNIDGVVLADSDIKKSQIKDMENHINRPEVQQAIYNQYGISQRYSNTVKISMLYVATKYQQDKGTGFIRIAMPLSDIDLLHQKLNTILMISVSAAFLISILVGFVLSRYISRPIASITKVSAAIAAGDFSKKSRVRTKDELEDLSNTINFMSDQIEHRVDEVERNRAQLEAVLQSMIDGVMVVAPDGNVIIMNQSLRSLLGVNGDPCGRSVLEIIRNLEVKDFVDRTILLTDGVLSEEIVILLPEQKNILVHGTPVRQSGIAGAVAIVFHDITELRKLSTLRRDFVANVSHELRTPISSIRGYAETLLDGAIDDKENAGTFLSIINDESLRLIKLINDLLDLSALESDHLELTIEEISVKEVIDTAIKTLANVASKNGITLTSRIVEEDILCHLDRDKILQVLMNLIDNGINHNPSGTEVVVSAGLSGNQLIVTVADDGVGIPTDDLSRIFERFYRVDKSRSRENGGTGLGLAIVKHIVSAHGGLVSVDSTMGKGTSFSFSIPL